MTRDEIMKLDIDGIESSVSQIKTWLAEQEGLIVPSLNKKVVADVVAKRCSTTPPKPSSAS